MRLVRFLSRWGAALAMMAVIFTASSLRSDELPDAGPFDLPFKKSGHFLGYALLGAAYRRGLAGGRPAALRDTRNAVLLAVLYACSDEFHQRFTPGRTPSFLDVGIDGLGAAAGSALAAWRARRAPRLTGRT